MPAEAEPVVYATKEGVEQQSAKALKKRFRIAMHAPVLQDERLVRDFGYLGDTAATRQVLEGTYEYPEEMDDHTRMIFEEAQFIFQKMSDVRGGDPYLHCHGRLPVLLATYK